MDRKLLAIEGIYEGDDTNQSGNDSDVFQNNWESEKESYQEENLVGVVKKTVGHFFPRFNNWLKRLTDIRNQDLITYRREVLVWVGLILLLTKQGARKKITDFMRNEKFCKNLTILSGDYNLKQVPHGDSLEYLFCRMQESEVEQIPVKMIKELIKSRAIERERFLCRYYMIAIDGVHVHTFDYKHCEHCLKREDDKGNKWWMHYKLEASLVSNSGLCLPILDEWIENEPDYVKQDCELKAFKRLVRKIREKFPRLPICLLLDGLYANQPVFNLLNELKIQYIVVFKEKSMSFVYPWIMDLKKHIGKDKIIYNRDEIEIAKRGTRTHEQRLQRNHPLGETRTKVKETIITWQAAMEFNEERSLFNVMTCKEMIDGKTTCDYVWLVSDGLNLSEDNVEKLVEAGRCRWNIENQGFNTLKNGGYHLKHLYSKDEVSLKIWHVLINIAHIINQLIEKGSLISKKAFGAIANIAKKMFEHFRYFIYRPPEKFKRFQIRLCWDTS